jgi:hypothetical protein
LHDAGFVATRLNTCYSPAHTAADVAISEGRTAERIETIEGTWRFVRAMVRDEFGNPRPSPYEGQGMGRIVIGGGRMAVMMIDWRCNIAGDQKREYIGYTVSYTYDGKQLVATVDAAPDPSRIGTEQPRGVRFENGLMILTPPPRVVDGVTEHREIAWEKVSDV